MDRMTRYSLPARVRAALRYFRSLAREPVSEAKARARKEAVNAELRRYVIECQLIRAVREAVSPTEAEGKR